MVMIRINRYSGWKMNPKTIIKYYTVNNTIVDSIKGLNPLTLWL